MFPLWRKLFPSTRRDDPCGGLSRDETRDRLSHVPKLWTGLIHELYTADVDASVIWTPSIAFADAVRCTSEPAWRAAWETGFVSTLAELIRSGYICGFTREQLVSSSDARIVGRCALMVDLFVSCVERILSRNDQDELSQLLDVFQNTIVGLYDKLWDIRDPFLVEQPASARSISTDSSDHISRKYLRWLYLTLDTLGHLTAQTFKKHRNSGPPQSHIRHVCLAIWLYSSDAHIRAQVFATFIELEAAEKKSWVTLAADFFPPEALGNAHIAQACLRDLAEETTLGGYLDGVLGLLGIWWGTRICAPPEAQQLTSYSLAAARRQLCRGGASDPKKDIKVLGTMFEILRAGSMASRRQCYIYFDLLCRYALLLIQTDNHTDGPRPIAENAAWVYRQFAKLAPDDRPKTTAMQQHTLLEWQAVTDEIADRQLAADAQWRKFLSNWHGTRALMLAPASPSEPVHDMVFGPLERCAWVACLCSTHKPAHRMRVCKGCERVAYCGELCQKGDWESGGHRERCRRRAA